MRLEDLEYFVAVAEEEHVGRAALRLGLSQPALTKAIQRLERELGFPLFERHPKGVALTALARNFHERIRLVRRQLQDAIDEAGEAHLGMIGVLRVGVAPAYARYPFAPAAEALRLQRPAVRMQISIALIDELMAGLAQGQLDLAICALGNACPAGFRQTPLFRDDLRIAARKGHPLLARKSLAVEDLAEASWMLSRSSVPARRNLEARWSEHGLPPPRVAVEVDTTVAQLIDFLGRSDLLTLMGELSLRTDPVARLQALPLKEGHWPRTAGYLMREHTYVPPLVGRYLEILHEVCETAEPR